LGADALVCVLRVVRPVVGGVWRPGSLSISIGGLLVGGVLVLVLGGGGFVLGWGVVLFFVFVVLLWCRWVGLGCRLRLVMWWWLWG
ncbi:hypothetical protein, partial [Pseudomonas syringae group genomosp. 7]|uniref:hypothetical protein n=1 Tax=Pseudomonas syringae group genomosp. 7 TaxID=251699 RepID=UPI00376F850A